VVNGVAVPARLWEGRTASGVEVQMLVTRVAANEESDLSEFMRELTEQRKPEFPVLAFPLRMILLIGEFPTCEGLRRYVGYGARL